ncbi:phosphotransferase family protein [Alicyclobacillus macrosporangiidus]|uniref:Predicted kinase, aminoglycoside phosphotransferase (APT) family n=1 Tax=Alicyclobacillus macrosporangiidus TaxID=392015 RepID=A0A1I7LBN8_9BACL|nr:phosphotransferase family protein [Alicyclobacillus macrosporangiidus]SFV07090.1 Predicted kinase, aminoglycoside phosphotransferase (APT) family [Alicyclobacillus macrosporangiidus]
MNVREVKGTIPVRPGEGFDVGAVQRYLAEHVSGWEDGPLEVVQFPTGASNLTYLIQSGERVAVLRRPPLGPLPPKAHDMKRESSFLAHLHPVFPLAPRPLAFCDDPAVIGGPFYVMEYRPGVVLDAEFPEGVAMGMDTRAQISESFVQALVRLHAVDAEASGLMAFGHPEGFLERQVKGWIDRYHRAKTDDIPGVDRLTGWLADHVPPSPQATVIHNDYKLNNLILDQDNPTRIVAIVDWEMATVGDPLFDLGVTLSYWTQPDDPEPLQRILPTVTRYPGFYTRARLIERYAELSGRDVGGIEYYQVFAYFKLAVILQQIYVRWVRGQTRDERFATFGERVRVLIHHALSHIG